MDYIIDQIIYEQFMSRKKKKKRSTAASVLKKVTQAIQ